MDSIIAVVLCGGAGTRLFPLTEKRSKPDVPLLGKYKLVDIPVSSCLNSGINRIFILTQFNSAGLNRHITDTYRMDPFGNGFVSVLAAEQTPHSRNWYQGTADAVRQVLHHLESHSFSHVLVLSGDQLYQMDFAEMLARHKAACADISVATTPVALSDAPGFGIMRTSEDDEIVVFREKPSISELSDLVSDVDPEMSRQGKHYLASTGIYLFDRETLEHILTSRPDVVDFGKEVIPQALGDWKVVSYPFTGYWSDVGSIRSYHAANMELARANSPLSFYDATRRIHTKHETLPPPKIQGSYLQDVIMAEGSHVEHCKIYSSVLGARSYVGARTTIKNSVILGAEYFRGQKNHAGRPLGSPANPGIADACYIENAVIDLNVSIMDGVVIANHDEVLEGEGENYYIRDGIIVIPRNAVIPAGTVIGSSARLDLPKKVLPEMIQPAIPVGLTL